MDTHYRKYELKLNGVEIEVEHKNIKHLHLAVYPPDGRVHVSAPIRYSEEMVQLYVNQKWVWVMEKRALFAAIPRQSEREFVSGEAHYWLGENYRLKVDRESTGAYAVEKTGDYLVLHVHQNTTKEHLRELLYGWYRAQLSPILERYIEKWQKELGVELAAWEIREMKARWGSCSKAKRKALFNVRLAMKPLDCIEYVVLHELCHLIEANHSPRFYYLLQIHMPEWQNRNKKLNEYPM